uniref:39S ribosomal protein L30, mitochondrial n=1 Tax=Acrobeloides nanus TaxID=290746 RepID=A0A914C8B7_9BILA
MPEKPPKLWVAWLYRGLINEPKWIKNRVYKLFGPEIKPGELQVFKNTSAFNYELWHIKHLIELRPMTFPNGEPTMESVNRIEVTPEGQCIVHSKENAVDPKEIKYVDRMKQFTPGYLRSRLNTRDRQCKDVYEDTVYNPANISIID